MRTFAVDDVRPVTTRAPQDKWGIAHLFDGKLHSSSRGLGPQVQRPSFPGINGLAAAVHLAFSEHRPLTLSPDALWLSLVQTFALHVRGSQDQLRERFVKHHGKAKLAVSLLELEVPSVVDGFLTALAGEVNPGLIKALSSRFSTTSDDEHTAHGIAVMDSMSPFFDYEVRCVCGIPSVTLLGTPDDWRSLRARFAVLAEYDLQGWAKLLTPVLDQLVRSSEGEVDREFWQSIYKPKSAYGADLATGWLVRLFPYTTDLSGHVRRLEVTPRKGWVHEPIATSALPNGLSCATLRVASQTAEPQLVTLYSGFFGVNQCADGSIEPNIGWAAFHDSLAQTLTTLAAAHPGLRPARPDLDLPEGPAALRAFLDRYDGGVLYGGALTLVGRGEVESENSSLLARLRDGGRLVLERGKVVWVKAPASRRVVADSVLELLQQLASSATFPPWPEA